MVGDHQAQCCFSLSGRFRADCFRRNCSRAYVSKGHCPAFFCGAERVRLLREHFQDVKFVCLLLFSSSSFFFGGGEGGGGSFCQAVLSTL